MSSSYYFEGVKKLINNMHKKNGDRTKRRKLRGIYVGRDGRGFNIVGLFGPIPY